MFMHSGEVFEFSSGSELLENPQSPEIQKFIQREAEKRDA
jgi:hypothetical protein